MQSKFTEQDTERYYDEEDTTYRSFWDPEGSLHWGYFDDTTGNDFLTASRHLNDIMLARSGIDSDSVVLDLGCGNGNTTNWLGGAEVVPRHGDRPQRRARQERHRGGFQELPPELASKLDVQESLGD